MGCNLLLVQGDPATRRVLAIALEREKYTVYQAGTGDEALALLEKSTFDIVVSDLRLPAEITGLDILRRQNKKSPAARLVLTTAYGSPQAKAKAEALGARYLEKPISLESLFASLASA
jgi:two-component system response regulator PilR (NtrC family)